MTLSWYLTLSLYWPWQGSPEVTAEPGVYAFHCEHQASLAPLVLTWSPDEGFGQASKAELGREEKCQ